MLTLSSYQYTCKLCGEAKESLGPVPDQLCDRCWELKVRIESQPELAKSVLDSTGVDEG